MRPDILSKHIGQSNIVVPVSISAMLFVVVVVVVVVIALAPSAIIVKYWYVLLIYKSFYVKLPVVLLLYSIYALIYFLTYCICLQCTNRLMLKAMVGCLECLGMAIQYSPKKECPMCRAKINMNKLKMVCK